VQNAVLDFMWFRESFCGNVNPDTSDHGVMMARPSLAGQKQTSGSVSPMLSERHGLASNEMKFAQINDYLQTLATVGAIAGLILVAYEVRQSNNFAISEAASWNCSNGLNRQLGLLDAEVAETLAKAMTKQASELILTEKIVLNLYLWSWVIDWEHKINRVLLLGIDVHEGIAGLQKIAADAAPFTFGTAFARAWLEVNRDAIEPDLLNAIDQGLENAPLRASRDYYQRIDDIAASLEKG
jgi:hypothetical protein